MYLCGYVACSARAPAQHCCMCCANERNIVGPRFDDRETMKFDQFQTSSNNFQQVATTGNNIQHGVQNARNMLGPTMLRAFARAFIFLLFPSLPRSFYSIA